MFQVLVGDQVDTPDLPTFSFNSVASATGDFSEENKLGQGGFGTVYKVNQLNSTFLRLRLISFSSQKKIFNYF